MWVTRSRHHTGLFRSCQNCTTQNLLSVLFTRLSWFFFSPLQSLIFQLNFDILDILKSCRIFNATGNHCTRICGGLTDCLIAVGLNVEVMIWPLNFRAIRRLALVITVGLTSPSVQTSRPVSNFRLACSRVLTDEGHLYTNLSDFNRRALILYFP
jgi:hypothetical protein